MKKTGILIGLVLCIIARDVHGASVEDALKLLKCKLLTLASGLAVKHEEVTSIAKSDEDDKIYITFGDASRHGPLPVTPKGLLLLSDKSLGGDIEKLNEIPDGLEKIEEIKKLRIESAYNFEKIVLRDNGKLGKVQQLTFVKMDNLNEIALEDTNLANFAVSDAKKIKAIELTKNKNLKNIYLANLPVLMLINNLFTNNNVVSFTIKDCPLLQVLELTEAGNLETLDITNCPKITRISVSKDAYDRKESKLKKCIDELCNQLFELDGKQYMYDTKLNNDLDCYDIEMVEVETEE